MEVLNGYSLQETLDRCNDYSGYQAVIAFTTREREFEFTREFGELHSSSSVPGVRRVCGGSALRIEFENGSYIKSITSSTVEKSRGDRCNEILYESGFDIGNPDIYYALQHMLIPYRCGDCENAPENKPIKKKKREETIRQSKELDRFLSSFKINP